jgi:hypothetical protein
MAFVGVSGKGWTMASTPRAYRPAQGGLITYRGLRNLCAWQTRVFGHGLGDRLELPASVHRMSNSTKDGDS